MVEVNDPQLGNGSLFVVWFRRFQSWVMFFLVFGALSLLFGWGYHRAVTHNSKFQIVFALGLSWAVISSAIAFFFNELIVVKMTKAVRVKGEVVEKYKLQSLVADLDYVYARSGLRACPHLYLIPEEGANACAFGWGLPGFSSIAVTSGLLKHIRNRDQLRAILAHELGHIRNKDVVVAVLIVTIISAFAHTASFIFDILTRQAFDGDDRKKDDDEKKEKSSGWVLLLVAGIFGIVGKFVGPFLALAVNRSREYSADALAAQTMGTGEPLAQALETLSRLPNTVGLKKAAKHFFFVPALWMASREIDLFSTHPAVTKRIARARMFDGE